MFDHLILCEGKKVRDVVHEHGLQALFWEVRQGKPEGGDTVHVGFYHGNFYSVLRSALDACPNLGAMHAPLDIRPVKVHSEGISERGKRVDIVSHWAGDDLPEVFVEGEPALITGDLLLQLSRDFDVMLTTYAGKQPSKREAANGALPEPDRLVLYLDRKGKKFLAR